MTTPRSWKENMRQRLALLANPAVIFWSLPWLMVLLIGGTIAQTKIDIHDATQIYFTSLIYWIGPLPTPGGLSIMALLFISLSIKFFFFSVWSWQKSGTILTHLGVLILLFGGLMTVLTSKEGFMIIPEGETTSHFTDYYDRQLVLSTRDGNYYYAFENIREQDVMDIGAITITILKKCENCGAQAPSGTYNNLQGLAQNMELLSVPSLREKEANLSGLIVDIKNDDTPNENGTYIIMEDIPRFPTLTTKDNHKTTIQLTRGQTQIPFSVTLKDFRKIDYDGTNKAKDFQSDLIIQDKLLSWPVTIRMNEPYRYRGYTFFQSSFDQTPDQEITVLTVVQNKGRLFPYIATGTILLGLLIHLVIAVYRRRRTS